MECILEHLGDLLLRDLTISLTTQLLPTKQINTSYLMLTSFYLGRQPSLEKKVGFSFGGVFLFGFLVFLV